MNSSPGHPTSPVPVHWHRRFTVLPAGGGVGGDPRDVCRRAVLATPTSPLHAVPPLPRLLVVPPLTTAARPPSAHPPPGRPSAPPGPSGSGGPGARGWAEGTGVDLLYLVFDKLDAPFKFAGGDASHAYSRLRYEFRDDPSFVFHTYLDSRLDFVQFFLLCLFHARCPPRGGVDGTAPSWRVWTGRTPGGGCGRDGPRDMVTGRSHGTSPVR